MMSQNESKMETLMEHDRHKVEEMEMRLVKLKEEFDSERLKLEEERDLEMMKRS